jgi:hypothetical protein
MLPVTEKTDVKKTWAEKARLAGLGSPAGDQIRERAAGPGGTASNTRILHDLSDC